MFDLKKDWTCTVEHKAGSDKVTVTLTPPPGAPTDTAAVSYTISLVITAGGVQRGIVLEK